MAITDPITDVLLARRLIESALAWNEMPELLESQVDDLMQIAGSLDADSLTVYTIADLNRAASLGCDWKAAAASKRFKVGVGPGKSFELQQLYDHWAHRAEQYATGQRSVVGSVDVDDGTGAPGRRSRVGVIATTSVMNT